MSPEHEHELVHEELVAYLDGELDADACRQLEARLADDQEYRLQLQQLQRTWDCLDELPRSTAKETFAQTTAEMVAVQAEKEVAELQASLPVRQRKRYLTLLVTCIASAAASFVLAAALWPDLNDQLLDDLPVVKELELYQRIDSVPFLEALHESGLFDEDSSDQGEP